MEEKQMQEAMEELMGLLDEDIDEMPDMIPISQNLLNTLVKSQTYGTSIRSINGNMHLAYLDEDGYEIASTVLMPDIVNVQNPNSKTVFVDFADGTKEIAHLNDGDDFSLEVGIMICIVKKMLSGRGIIGTGSSAYNKVMKYALSKIDAKKKKRQEEVEKAKEQRLKTSKAKQDARQSANKEREAKIRLLVEAFKRATKEISEEAKAEIMQELDFNKLLNDLAEEFENDAE